MAYIQRYTTSTSKIIHTQALKQPKLVVAQWVIYIVPYYPLRAAGYIMIGLKTNQEYSFMVGNTAVCNICVSGLSNDFINCSLEKAIHGKWMGRRH